MLLRPTWGSNLESLESFIIENKNKMDQELLLQLTDIYNTMCHNEETSFDNAIEDELFEVDEHTRKIQGQFDSMKDKIENEFEKFQGKFDDELQESIMSELEDFEVEYYERSNNGGTDEETECIKKMIEAGYTFNSGIGLELTIKMQEEEREKEKQRQQEALEKRLKKEWESINKHNFCVKQIDEDTYSVYDYYTDATYNTLTGKVSGKGARKHKDEIIETVEAYTGLLLKYSMSKSAI